MAAPYVSIKRLTDNSLAAMLAAVEVYNKPQMTYRDEVVVTLVVNAWELALKAALQQQRISIFYRKKRDQPYRSISISDALERVSANGLWPDGVDGTAASANIKALTEYRDRAIHLYNATGLGNVIYPFLQQNVLNYRDFVLARFSKDLADSMTWQLLPLGATAPADAVQFMKADSKSTMVAEVEDFIGDLRTLMDEAEAAGGDPSRIAVIYDIHLRSQKKMTSADLVVAVSPTADGQIAIQKTDPNQTHPYSATELLERVNKKRPGRKLNSYDHQAVCWMESLRDNQKYAWRYTGAGADVWSGEAVTYLSSLTDGRYDEIRREYGLHLQTRRQAKAD